MNPSLAELFFFFVHFAHLPDRLGTELNSFPRRSRMSFRRKAIEKASPCPHERFTALERPISGGGSMSRSSDIRSAPEKLELETVTDWRMIALGGGLLLAFLAVPFALYLLTDRGPAA